MKSASARDNVWVLVTLILMIAPAYAAVQVNERTEIALTVFIPCAANGAGEIVDLAGPLHTLISFTISGNNVRGYTHFQPQGIVGIGETTGVKYRATGITQETFKNSFRNAVAGFAMREARRWADNSPELL
jgi:hypothetical protein